MVGLPTRHAGARVWGHSHPHQKAWARNRAAPALSHAPRHRYSLETDTITLPTEPPAAAGSAVEEVGDTSSDESGDRPIIPWMSAARARIRDAISELQEQEQDEFSLDDFFVKVFPNLMAHATPQKERATAIHFLMKELNRLEDDDIEDVMLRDGVIHFVKPPSS